MEDIEILRQRRIFYIKLQFSQVANIQCKHSETAIYKIPKAAVAGDLDWRIEASSVHCAIHLLLSENGENGRFRAHFVVNLEQIDVNSVCHWYSHFFLPFRGFLLLLRGSILRRSEGRSFSVAKSKKFEQFYSLHKCTKYSHVLPLDPLELLQNRMK